MYDEGEYGDTLKSWVVPTYMLCALINVVIALQFSYKYLMSIGIKSEWIWSWAHCFLEFKSLATVIGKTWDSGKEWENGERYKHLANALGALQMPANALSTLPMACECLRILTANENICSSFTEI